jgi:Flp pilus assembly protein TadG
MARTNKFLRRLTADRRGVAAIEFAIVAPLFFLVTMGVFDLSYQFYIKSALSGAIEKAGRNATLEGFSASQSALDDAVRDSVTKVYASATVTFTRKAYNGYADVGAPERFTDVNANNVFDSGECFQDSNGNGTWDSDAGTSGNGGADSVVSYTATAEINRVFPLWKMLGQPQVKRISATTVLRNQPFSDGTTTTATIC